MPTDPQIRVGITATTGQFEAALKNAAAQNEAFAEGFKRTTAAQEAYSAASAKGGKATRELEAAFSAAVGAGASYTEAMERAVAVSNQFAATQDRVASSTGKTVSSYYAAQGAARVLEGGIPIRAFEKFISTIAGVGPLLQAAFPVLGLIALGELAVDAGEKLYHAFDIGGERAEHTREEIDRVDNSFRTLIDSTVLETDKLEAADAKLQHKPNPNGLKLALDEALEAADRMSAKLDGLIDKQRTILADVKGGLSPSGAQSFLLNEQGNEREQRMLAEHNRYLDQAQNIQGQLNESKSYGVTLQARLNDLLEKQSKIQEIRTGAAGIPGGEAALVGIGLKDYSKEIASVNFLIEAQQKEQRSIQATIDLQKEQVNHEEIAAKVRGQQKENYADNLAKLEEQRGGKNIVFEVEYWRQVVAETGKYHEQLLRAEEEEGKLAAKMGEASKFKKELARDEERTVPKPATTDLQKFIDYENQTGEAYARYREEVAKGNQVLTENADRLREVNIQIAEQSGAITKVQADHALGAAKAKEYADRIAELRDQMAALRASLPQAQIEGKGGEVSAEIQRLQNQIYVLQGQAATAGAQNQAKTTQDLAAPYIKATDEINSAWLSMQNKLIFGTRNVSQAFANMGVSMLESFAAAWEKMLVKQLQAEIRMMIQHQVTKQAEVAGDAAAAAESDRISELSSIKQVFHAAKVAATKAFKHYADVPPVPFVAAAAAAGTFALALSVGAFEKGGLITAPTLALMGESGAEAVLPNNLTKMLVSAANNYSSSSSSESTVFNQQNHYSGISDRDFRQKLRKHSAEVGHAVVREMRGGRRR